MYTIYIPLYLLYRSKPYIRTHIILYIQVVVLAAYCNNTSTGNMKGNTVNSYAMVGTVYIAAAD